MSLVDEQLGRYPNMPLRAFWAILKETSHSASESLSAALELVQRPECGLERRSTKQEGRFGVGQHVLILKHSATPILIATVANRLDAVAALVELGADFKAKTDRINRGALHYATEEGNVDAIRFLCRLGLDINDCDADGYSPLHIAAEYGILDVVILLIELGANVRVDTASITPLHRAATYGHTEVAKVLIMYGALVDALDDNGPFTKQRPTGTP